MIRLGLRNPRKKERHTHTVDAIRVLTVDPMGAKNFGVRASLARRHKFVSKCAQIAPNHLRTRAQKALDLMKIMSMTEHIVKQLLFLCPFLCSSYVIKRVCTRANNVRSLTLKVLEMIPGQVEALFIIFLTLGSITQSNTHRKGGEGAHTSRSHVTHNRLFDIFVMRCLTPSLWCHRSGDQSLRQ